MEHKVKLPTSIVTRSDVNRLLRELNSLNDTLAGTNSQPSGSVNLPNLTEPMAQLAKGNKINLLDATQRKFLEKEVHQIVADAPVLHISFASDPAPRTLEYILVWLRNNIHPQALLLVGLQPTIAAGCVLRTRNQVFDMSLRSRLVAEQPNLVRMIQELDK